MKITVIGGGPGGLYSALLIKKARPDFNVEVFEQNRADDTFGFGVVFSDETLDEFLSADIESYDLIRDSFAVWTDIAIEHRGDRAVIGGNGFAGCSRMTLLQMLHKRCAAVGVGLHFEAHIPVDEIDSRFADSDIIIAADGINSPIRTRYATEFGCKIIEKRNKFVWLGSKCPLDAFTFFFRETEHGLFCAHTYEYEIGQDGKSMSTWVVETTPECWQAAGYADMDEETCAKALEEVFKADLKGHPFITNRSMWRNFPKITCDKWHHRNIVMVGDNKASAHWSIGSGTKLAMECAIGLAKAILDNEGDTEGAFDQYEADRRTPVEIIQHNAEVSLTWFENMEMHWLKEGAAFEFCCMTRAKSITWDNLKLRDPAFLAKCEADFYAKYLTETGRDVADQHPTPMFTPFDIRAMTVMNRVAVAPMAQYSAVDGMPQSWHFSHYTARAMGGAGLIFTEMTCPSADARITEGCTGLWNGEQQAAWAEIVDFIHDNSTSKVALQLGHAGRKGSTKTPEFGADMPMDTGNWPIISASPIAYIAGVSDTPAEITREQMNIVRDDFVSAAKRGAEAGFDMLELHCAHGYLLASFLSPLTNRRSDEYGGTAENRAKFPVEVFKACREVWPEDRPMSVRLSSCDWMEGGITLDDLVIIGKAFKDAGVDIIHASSGETVKGQKPVYGRMWQTPFAEHIKHHVGIPTIAVGDITLPEQINTIVAGGRADLCALGRPHLNDAFFTRKAAGHYGVEDQNWPVQLTSGQYQLFREAEKTNEKQLDLAIKARPNRRHYTQATR